MYDFIFATIKDVSIKRFSSFSAENRCRSRDGILQEKISHDTESTVSNSPNVVSWVGREHVGWCVGHSVVGAGHLGWCVLVELF